MWETCAVELRVRLPQPVAAEVEEVQRRDPEMLSRLVVYAMARRRIFEHLASRDDVDARVSGESGLDGADSAGIR